MKIYYSRTNGTNDAINSSVLQEIIRKLGISSDVEVMKYNAGETYTYNKLDSADIMIIGYNMENVSSNYGNGLTIGKGVYDECQRAFAKEIPVFFINVNYDSNYEIHHPANNKCVGLESISQTDINKTDISWKEYGYVHISKFTGAFDPSNTNGCQYRLTLAHTTEQWRNYINYNSYKEIDFSKYKEEVIISLSPGTQVSTESNIKLLLLCR